VNSRIPLRAVRVALGLLVLAMFVALPAAQARSKAPRLTAATTRDVDRDGRIDAIRLRFSAPVRLTRKGRPIKVQGHGVRTMRKSKKAKRTIDVRVAESRTPDGGRQLLVRVLGKRFRGARGAVQAHPKRTRDGAAPVLVSGRLSGFWASGQTLQAVWSEPVVLTKKAAGARFDTRAGGKAASITSVRKGSSANMTNLAVAGSGWQPTALAFAGATGDSGVRDRSRNYARKSRKPVGLTADVPQPVASVDDPINPDFQMKLPFGTRSHWIQPWRAYLDTWPASRLRNSIGINFNVTGTQQPLTARVLQDAGFSLARVEVGWGTINYDTGQIDDSQRGRFIQTLQTLKANGLRPLIVLNSNQAIPCPMKAVTLTLAAPAHKGDTTVQLAAGSVGAVVPGRTGFFNAADNRAADPYITSVSGTIARLSRPLPYDLPAGAAQANTTKYAPFGMPLLNNGSPNPSFEDTLSGWLHYVDIVTSEARRALGSTDFDVEIWNELSFGSDFLYQRAYYDPDPAGQGTLLQTILDRTVAYLRDPARHLDGMGIGNGFANQAPWPNGNESPPGLTAIDKHPYGGLRRFPSDEPTDGNRPIDAAFQTNGTHPTGSSPWTTSFVPHYDAFLPEYFLTAIQTETLVRDLSPLRQKIGGIEHGRDTAPPGGTPPGMWITEVNIGPGGMRKGAGITVTPADVDHVQAKTVLRYLSAYVGKGVQRIYFYAAEAGDLGLISPSFFTALAQSKGKSAPGLDGAGTTLQSVHRLLKSLGTANPRSIHPLSLNAIGDYAGNTEFDGDGAPGRPALFDRDVVAFFPFQTNDHSYVIPTYVMTRNVLRNYKPGAPDSDVSRYDLPPAVYRLTVGGLGSCSSSFSATDPLTGNSVPVRVVSCDTSRAVVEMPLTDSPRLLTIDGDR